MREFFKGIVGVSGSLAWITMANFETAVRITCSLVGLAVGVLTLVSLVQGMRAKKDK